jgi:hypothetical protein
MQFLDEHHIVNGWTHGDANGAGKVSDIVSLKNWSHVAIVLDFGNMTAGGDADIVVYACDDVAPSNVVALNNYTFRKSPGSTASDAFAAPVTITDSKIDLVAGGDIIPDTDDNSIVVIDVDAAQVLAAGTAFVYDCIKIAIPSPGQATPVGCKFVLSGPRHAAAVMASVIID